MVIKSKTKPVPVKKPLKPKTIAKKPASTADESQKSEFKAIIEIHTKQLQRLDKMFVTLERELKDIKKMVISQKEVTAEKKADVKTSKATPVKKPQIAPTKAVTAQSPLQAVKKPVTNAKKTLKPTAVTAVKSVKIVESKSFSNDMIEIPKDIADRINNLTSKKKITQTQLGKEVDLSQKAIHEIATRKVKDLNKEKLLKIASVLKKYEAK